MIDKKTKKKKIKNKKFSKYFKKFKYNITDHLNTIISSIENKNEITNINQDLSNKIPKELYEALITGKLNNIGNEYVKHNPKLLLINKIKKRKNIKSWLESIYPINNNILVIILSCQKNKHLWKNKLNEINNSIIICGDGHLNQDFLLDDRILYLKCNDLYDGLPEKIICMINSI